MSFSQVGYGHEPGWLMSSRALRVVPDDFTFNNGLRESYLSGREGNEGGVTSCGVIKKDNSKYKDIPPEELLFDRFGNAYTHKELSLIPSSFKCSVGYFDIYFKDNFGGGELSNVEIANMERVVCNVFDYISNLIRQRETPNGCEQQKVKIYFNDMETDDNIAAAASPIFQPYKLNCDESLLCRPYIKINGGTVLNASGSEDFPLADGIIDINIEDHDFFYWDSTVPLTIGSSQADFYTVILHEALHVLGYASTLKIGFLYAKGFSFWDQFLFAETGGGKTPLITGDCIDNCWDINKAIPSGNLQTFDVFDYSSNAEGEVVSCDIQWSGNSIPNIFFGKNTNYPIQGGVEGFGIIPSVFLNSLSHLGGYMGDENDYLMASTRMDGTHFREISQQEKNILFELGYDVIGGTGCNNNYVIAQDDGFGPNHNYDGDNRPYAPPPCCFHYFSGCIGDNSTNEVRININDLLCNDASGDNLQVTAVSKGNYPSNVTISQVGTEIIIGSDQIGVFKFYYTIGSANTIDDDCTCKLSTGYFVVEYDMCYDCTGNDPCQNLLCVDDFNDTAVPIRYIPPFYYLNFSSTAFFGYPFIFEGSTNQTPDLVYDMANSFVLFGRNTGNTNLASTETIVLELTKPILPQCELVLSVDLGTSQIGNQMLIWGSEFPPCHFTDTYVEYGCGNVETQCNGYTYRPFCLGGISPSVLGTRTSPVFNTENFNWMNNTETPINYLILLSDEAGLIMDNIVATQAYPATYTYESFCNTVSFFSDFDSEGFTHSWDFGDGNSSTEANPTHTYATHGMYFVTHTLIDDCGNEFEEEQEVETGECIEVPLTCACGNNTYNLALPASGKLLSELINQNNWPPNLLDLGIGGCMAISGKLIVDVPYIFAEGQIKMQPESEIIINKGIAFTLSGINEQGANANDRGIYGCDRMWNGITVKGGLHIMNCVVQDAFLAVSAGEESVIRIENSEFEDNYIALYHTTGDFTLENFSGNTIKGVEPLLPYPTPYQGFIPALTSPHFGVTINGHGGAYVIGGTQGTLNTFENLKNGISIVDANVSILNTRFLDIIKTPNNDAGSSGYAVWAKEVNGGGSLFQKGLGNTIHSFSNCTVGIYTENIDTRILNNKMDNVTTGIEVSRAKYDDRVKIYNNHINANFYGIRLKQTTYANSININDNTITLGQPGWIIPVENGAIHITEMPDRAVEDKANIYDNDIYLNNSGSKGFFIRSASQLKVENNSIESLIEGATTGIHIEMGQDCKILDNPITGLGSVYGSGSIGMYIEGSPNTRFACNVLDNLGTGMEFVSGNSEYTDLEGNTFTPPFKKGLYYHPVAQQYPLMIGTQEQKWNRWEPGTYYEAAAQNDIWANFLQDVANQQYIVGAPTPPYMPQSIAMPNAYSGASSDWFKLQEYTGLPPIICLEVNDNSEDFLPVPGDDKLAQKYIDRGGFSKNAISWQAERQLYHNIKKGSSDIVPGSFLDLFMQDAEQGLMNSFYSIRRQMEDFYVNPTGALTDLTTSRDALIDDLIAVDILLAQDEENSDLLAQRENILTALQQNANQISAEVTAVKAATIPLINAAITDNANIVPATAFQQNEKTVNHIYMEYLLDEDGEFSDNQKELLLQIAGQCPWEGGRAVYQARSLYALVKDTSFVDACNPTMGLSRNEDSDTKAFEMMNEKENFESYHSFTVYPNPAKELLQINYEIEQDANLVIYNLYGEKVLEHDLSKEDVSTIINMHHFQNGVYFLRIYDEADNELHTQKLIISK